MGVHVTGDYYVIGGLYTASACVDWFRKQCADDVDYATWRRRPLGRRPAVWASSFLPHLRLPHSPLR